MRNFNPELETESIVDFIKDQKTIQNTKGATIGLSGGIDSCVCAALLVRALGPEHVLGIAMPEKQSSPNDLKDAQLIAKWLGIELKIQPLTPLLEMFGLYEYMKNWDWDDIKQRYYLNEVKELIPMEIEYAMIMKLRGRAYILTNESKKINYLQCQTINKSEWLLGMFDKFGDTIGDIAPMWHLYKTEVFALGKYLDVSERIMEREPSCGLFPIKMTETEEMGMSHEDMDELLYYFDTLKLQNKEFVENKFSKKTIDKVRNWIKVSEVKRQIPIQL